MERDYESQVLLHSKQNVFISIIALEIASIFQRFHFMNTIWDRTVLCVHNNNIAMLNSVAFTFLYAPLFLLYEIPFAHSFLLLFIPFREFSYRITPVHVLYDRIRVWCCRKLLEIRVAIIAVVQSMRKERPSAIRWRCV